MLFVALALSACQGGAEPAPIASATPLSIPMVAATAVATDISTPTATVTSLPSPSVAPTSTATVSPSATPAASSYVVVAGDTLLAIAERHGTTVEALLALNQLTDPDSLAIGEVLYLPALGTGTTPVVGATAAVDATSAPMAQVERAYACPPRAVELALPLPDEAIRIALAPDAAYLLAGGDLYRLDLEELAAAASLHPESAMPPERQVGSYWIQELVDVAVEPGTGDLLLLDKTNDIYRRDASGRWSVEYTAAPIAGVSPDPQYLALTADGDAVFVLDADLARIWRLARGQARPTTYASGGSLSDGVDLAFSDMAANGDASLVVLTENGGLEFFGPSRSTSVAVAPGWPAEVTGGSDRLLVVDGHSREVALLGTASGQLDVIFRFEGMRRLRSAAFDGSVLYAIAGDRVYRLPLSAVDDACEPVMYDDRYLFDGVDVVEALAGFDLPFTGAALPSRPRSFPGARRLYRYGIHEGLDLYPGDVSGLYYGSAVLAAAEGVVTRSDASYVELTAGEYESAMARVAAEHRAPPNLLDRLRGRQVRLSHGPEVESRYCHLSAVGEANVGDTIAAGVPVGQVGVSGTSAGVYGGSGGAHLHFEIWLRGRYLGHGLGLYETMRLWQAVFG